MYHKCVSLCRTCSLCSVMRHVSVSVILVVCARRCVTCQSMSYLKFVLAGALLVSVPYL